jgi:hypothetical protein
MTASVSAPPVRLWDAWKPPTAAQQLAFAKQVVPHVKWLHPAIVAGIARDNDDPNRGWRDWLGQVADVPVADYLWAGSPCVFPGIRRSTGARLNTRDSLTAPGCLRTDPSNNHYPQEIWDRVMQVAQPTKAGSRVVKVGKPVNFHLAHLIHHKDFNLTKKDQQRAQSAEQGLEGLGWLQGPERPSTTNAFAGLFTSAANLCFLPAELMKPTDISGPLLHLLLQRAVALYSDVCTLFPHNLTFRAPNPLGWQHNDRHAGGRRVFCWDERPYGDPALTPFLNHWRRVELQEVLRLKLTPGADKQTPRLAAYFTPPLR